MFNFLYFIKLLKYFFLIHSIFLISNCFCFASESDEGVYNVIIKKQEKKRQERWSLASWYDTKEKIRLMDMWLALHSSTSLYEFFVGGDTATLESTLDSGTQFQPQIMNRAQLGAYASIFGLQAQYFDFKNQSYGWNPSFHIRVLGTSVQNTNLTLEYGLRNRVDFNFADKFNNHFAGTSLTLYIQKVFGIESLYRYYFPKSSNNYKSLEGQLVEATLFIDYSFLRVYGTFFEESLILTSLNLIKTNVRYSGIFAGLKFFF